MTFREIIVCGLQCCPAAPNAGRTGKRLKKLGIRSKCWLRCIQMRTRNLAAAVTEPPPPPLLPPVVSNCGNSIIDHITIIVVGNFWICPGQTSRRVALLASSLSFFSDVCAAGNDDHAMMQNEIECPVRYVSQTQRFYAIGSSLSNKQAQTSRREAKPSQAEECRTASSVNSFEDDKK